MLPVDTDVFPRKTGVYIVGGSIRDLLCGRTPIDYDLALTDTPEKFARLLAARISGHVVEFGQHGHTIRRVVTGDYHFDIMPLNGVSIEDDLRRRDFTINAMALDVSSGNLLDPTGGRQDLAAKRIRMVNRDVFRNDPVRLVRAYRMAANFDFTIDGDTQAAISQDADLIGKSAGERIKEELFKIFKSAESHAQLERMAHSGLLFSVFPELAQLKNCQPGKESQRDLFEQTLAAYDHLEKLLYSRDQNLPEPASRHVKNIGTARAILLKWAVLLQSIGQPSARIKAEAEADDHHCDAHAARSATIAGAICRRLRFSRHQSDTVEFLVRRHLEPFLCFKTRPRKVLADRAFIRLFMKCGDRTPDILLHALAGIMGRKAREDPSVKRFSEFVTRGIDCYYSTLRPRASTPPPLNGNDLVKYFGLKPSPSFKEILNAIEEEHLASRNLTREQALDLVEKLLNDRRKKVLPT